MMSASTDPSVHGVEIRALRPMWGDYALAGADEAHCWAVYHLDTEGPRHVADCDTAHEAIRTAEQTARLIPITVLTHPDR